MGSLVGGIIAACIVYNADTIGSTAAGLLLIYSLNFSEVVTFLARSHADVSLLKYCIIINQNQCVSSARLI